MKTDNQSTANPQGDFVSADEAEKIVDQRMHRKTLTMATVEAHPERAKTLNRPVLIARFTGEVRGTNRECSAEEMKKPEADREYFTAMVGRFTADAYTDDGEVFGFAGGQCYLPTGFHEAQLAAFAAACDQNDDNPFTSFDYEFAAVPSKSPAGYGYMARSLKLIDVDPNDSLALLRSQGDKLRASNLLPDFNSRRPMQQAAIEHQAAK